jgi:hypothetical protein
VDVSPPSCITISRLFGVTTCTKCSTSDTSVGISERGTGCSTCARIFPYQVKLPAFEPGKIPHLVSMRSIPTDLNYLKAPPYHIRYYKDMPDAGPLRPCATRPTPPGLAPAASKVNGWHPVAPYVDEKLELLKERSCSIKLVRKQASVVLIRRDCCDGLRVLSPPRLKSRAFCLVRVGRVVHLAHRCCGDIRGDQESERILKRECEQMRAARCR